MSKMSELSLVLEELKKCGESLVAISGELAEIFSASEETAEPEKKKAASKKKEAETETKAEPAPAAAKEYTFIEVRTILADKSRAGHTADVKKILTAHGAAKLSELDPKEYAAVVAEAEVLE